MLYKLKIVFSGLVYFGGAAGDSYTNVILANESQNTNHSASLMLPEGDSGISVVKMKNGKESPEKGRKLELNGDVRVILNVKNLADTRVSRSATFNDYVPSVQGALKSLYKEGLYKPSACTTADVLKDTYEHCVNHNGVVRLVGGALTPMPQGDEMETEYAFVDSRGKGKYTSKLTSQTDWDGEVSTIEIIKGDTRWTISFSEDRAGTIKVMNHPSKGVTPDTRHFGIFRKLLDRYNDGEQWFPVPREKAEAEKLQEAEAKKLQEAAAGKPKRRSKKVVPVFRYPPLCPPAQQ